VRPSTNRATNTIHELLPRIHECDHEWLMIDCYHRYTDGKDAEAGEWGGGGVRPSTNMTTNTRIFSATIAGKGYFEAEMTKVIKLFCGKVHITDMAIKIKLREMGGNKNV
jgi:hypothetical protein